jgi:hypothetical protein
VTAFPASPAVTTANQPLVRSASRCRAKVQVNEANSTATATLSQTGLSVESRGQEPSTAASLGKTTSRAVPATATTRARLTVVFQVSGRCCAASTAAAGTS